MISHAAAILLCALLAVLTAPGFVIRLVTASYALPDGGCAGEVNYTTAAMLCASSGARLPTLAEMKKKSIPALGCAVAKNRVWTSTACKNSKDASAPAVNIAFGGGPPANAADGGVLCSFTKNSHGVVCMRDDDASPPSSSPVAPPSQQPSSSTTPTTTKPTPMTVGGPPVPAYFVPSPCIATANYTETEEICASLGGAICTLAQLKKTNKGVLGCGAKNSRVFSSTPCVNSKDKSRPAVYIAYGSGPVKSLPNNGIDCSFTSNRKTPLCCAAPPPGSSSASPTRQLSSNPTAVPIPSPTAAPLAPTTKRLPPYFVPSPCVKETNYTNSAQICAAAGGSLCTLQQLKNTNKGVLGCGAKNSRVFSSTPCVNSKDPSREAVYVMYGSGPVKKHANNGIDCSFTSNVKAVLCCADSDGGDFPSPPSLSASPTRQLAGGPTASPVPEYEGGETDVPTPSYYMPQPCVAATYLEATTMCANSGGQVCTKAQVLSGKRPKLPCSSSSQRVWTSDACVNSKDSSRPAVTVAYGIGREKTKPNSGVGCGFTTDKKRVLCCAKTGGGNGTPSLAPTPSDAAPSPSVTEPPVVTSTAPHVSNAPSSVHARPPLKVPLPTSSANLNRFSGGRSNTTRPLARNLIFIISDDLKPTLSSFDAHPNSSTPNIDRLASRGVRFSRLFCQLAECGPSRASILTSLRPDTLDIYNMAASSSLRHKVKGAVTLAETLFNAGYRVYGMGKIQDGRTVENEDYGRGDSYDEPVAFNQNKTYCYDVKRVACPANLGWDPKTCKCLTVPSLKRSQDPLPYMLPGNIPDNGYLDDRLATYAVKKFNMLVSDEISGKYSNPWAMFVGFMKPHLPEACPARFFDEFSPASSLWLPPNRGPPSGPSNPYRLQVPNELDSYAGGKAVNTPLEYEQVIQSYLACSAWVDFQVGKLLEAFDAAPEVIRRETLIIFTADHGLHLGDHGTWGKHTVLEQSTRIPLIIVPPDNKWGEWRSNRHAGRVNRRPVESLDVMPTILDLLGIYPTPRVKTATLVGVALGGKLPRKVVASLQQISGVSARGLLTASDNVNDDQGRLRPFAISQYLRTGIKAPSAMGYAMRSRRYRYIRWIDFTSQDFNGATLASEFYDYAVDRFEEHNVVSSAQYLTVKKIFQEAMDAFLRSKGKSFPTGLVNANGSWALPDELDVSNEDFAMNRVLQWDGPPLLEDIEETTLFAPHLGSSSSSSSFSASNSVEGNDVGGASISFNYDLSFTNFPQIAGLSLNQLDNVFSRTIINAIEALAEAGEIGDLGDYLLTLEPSSGGDGGRRRRRAREDRALTSASSVTGLSGTVVLTNLPVEAGNALADSLSYDNDYFSYLAVVYFQSALIDAGISPFAGNPSEAQATYDAPLGFTFNSLASSLTFSSAPTSAPTSLPTAPTPLGQTDSPSLPPVNAPTNEPTVSPTASPTAPGATVAPTVPTTTTTSTVPTLSPSSPSGEGPSLSPTIVPTAASTNSTSSALSGGAIAGIVIGILAFFGLLGLLAVVVVARRSKREQDQKREGANARDTPDTLTTAADTKPMTPPEVAYEEKLAKKEDEIDEEAGGSHPVNVLASATPITGDDVNRDVTASSSLTAT